MKTAFSVVLLGLLALLNNNIISATPLSIVAPLDSDAFTIRRSSTTSSAGTTTNYINIVSKIPLTEVKKDTTFTLTVPLAHPPTGVVLTVLSNPSEAGTISFPSSATQSVPRSVNIATCTVQPIEHVDPVDITTYPHYSTHAIVQYTFKCKVEEDKTGLPAPIGSELSIAQASTSPPTTLPTYNFRYFRFAIANAIPYSTIPILRDLTPRETSLIVTDVDDAVLFHSRGLNSVTTLPDAPIFPLAIQNAFPSTKVFAGAMTDVSFQFLPVTTHYNGNVCLEFAPAGIDLAQHAFVDNAGHRLERTTGPDGSFVVDDLANAPAPFTCTLKSARTGETAHSVKSSLGRIISSEGIPTYFARTCFKQITFPSYSNIDVVCTGPALRIKHDEGDETIKARTTKPFLAVYELRGANAINQFFTPGSVGNADIIRSLESTRESSLDISAIVAQESLMRQQNDASYSGLANQTFLSKDRSLNIFVVDSEDVRLSMDLVPLTYVDPTDSTHQSIDQWDNKRSLRVFLAPIVKDQGVTDCDIYIALTDALDYNPNTNFKASVKPFRIPLASGVEPFIPATATTDAYGPIPTVNSPVQVSSILTVTYTSNTPAKVYGMRIRCSGLATYSSQMDATTVGSDIAFYSENLSTSSEYVPISMIVGAEYDDDDVVIGKAPLVLTGKVRQHSSVTLATYTSSTPTYAQYIYDVLQSNANPDPTILEQQEFTALIDATTSSASIVNTSTESTIAPTTLDSKITITLGLKKIESAGLISFINSPTKYVHLVCSSTPNSQVYYDNDPTLIIASITDPSTSTPAPVTSLRHYPTSFVLQHTYTGTQFHDIVISDDERTIVFTVEGILFLQESNIQCHITVSSYDNDTTDATDFENLVSAKISITVPITNDVLRSYLPLHSTDDQSTQVTATVRVTPYDTISYPGNPPVPPTPLPSPLPSILTDKGRIFGDVEINFANIPSATPIFSTFNHRLEIDLPWGVDLATASCRTNLGIPFTTRIWTAPAEYSDGFAAPRTRVSFSSQLSLLSDQILKSIDPTITSELDADTLVIVCKNAKLSHLADKPEGITNHLALYHGMNRYPDSVNQYYIPSQNVVIKTKIVSPSSLLASEALVEVEHNVELEGTDLLLTLRALLFPVKFNDALLITFPVDTAFSFDFGHETLCSVVAADAAALKSVVIKPRRSGYFATPPRLILDILLHPDYDGTQTDIAFPNGTSFTLTCTNVRNGSSLDVGTTKNYAKVGQIARITSDETRPSYIEGYITTNPTIDYTDVDEYGHSNANNLGFMAIDIPTPASVGGVVRRVKLSTYNIEEASKFVQVDIYPFNITTNLRSTVRTDLSIFSISTVRTLVNDTTICKAYETSYDLAAQDIVVGTEIKGMSSYINNILSFHFDAEVTPLGLTLRCDEIFNIPNVSRPALRGSALYYYNDRRQINNQIVGQGATSAAFDLQMEELISSPLPVGVVGNTEVFHTITMIRNSPLTQTDLQNIRTMYLGRLLYYLPQLALESMIHPVKQVFKRVHVPTYQLHLRASSTDEKEESLAALPQKQKQQKQSDFKRRLSRDSRRSPDLLRLLTTDENSTYVIDESKDGLYNTVTLTLAFSPSQASATSANLISSTLNNNMRSIAETIENKLLVQVIHQYNAGINEEPWYCFDGKLSRDESDIDCGFNACRQCDSSKKCLWNLDCMTNNCDKTTMTCSVSISDRVPDEYDEKYTSPDGKKDHIPDTSSTSAIVSMYAIMIATIIMIANIL